MSRVPGTAVFRPIRGSCGRQLGSQVPHLASRGYLPADVLMLAEERVADVTRALRMWCNQLPAVSLDHRGPYTTRRLASKRGRLIQDRTPLEHLETK